MKRDLIAIALMILIIIGFCQAIVFDAQSPNRGDIPLQFYPWKAYTRAMLSQGEVPYWNPYTHGGAPFLANMQSAVFYPLDLLLFLFPMERFYGLSLLLHFLLAGGGTYALARLVGVSAFPALLAGLAYSLNGFTMIHIPAGNHLTYAGAAWAPWMMFAAVGFITRPSRLFWGLLAALITWLHFLCGHPQMTFYSMVFSTLLGLALGLRLTEKRHYLIPLLRTFVFGLFLLLGIAMAGFQILPTLEYFQHTNRAGTLDLELATEFSFAPHRLLTLLFPEYYGTHLAGNHYDDFYFWSCAYAGAIIPVLALTTFFMKPRDRHLLPFAAIALIALFFAWGRGNPLYGWIMQLPGFGHFRAPAKYLPYYIVPACLLASIAVERLSSLAFLKQQETTRVEWARGIIPLSAVLLILLVYGTPLLSKATAIIRSVDDLADINQIKQFSLMRGGLILLAGFTLYLLARKIPKVPRLALSLSLAVLLCMDLFTYGQAYLSASLSTVSQIRTQTYPPVEVTSIKEQDSANTPGRIVTLKEIDYPNLFLHWRMPNIAGYDPMSLRSYNKLIGQMENWEEGSYHDNIQLDTTDHPVLDLLNVKYVFAIRPLDNPNLRLREDIPGNNFQVYQRQSEQRAWLSLAPRHGDEFHRPNDWSPYHEANLTHYAPHEIEFNLNLEDPAWLRISEWHYPGWKAILHTGEEETELTPNPSSEGFRVIPVSPEVQSVKFYYDAPNTGWILSILFIFLYLFLWVGYFLLKTDRIYPLFSRLMGRYY